jgi:hypothetical protein
MYSLLGLKSLKDNILNKKDIYYRISITNKHKSAENFYAVAQIYNNLVSFCWILNQLSL